MTPEQKEEYERLKSQAVELKEKINTEIAAGNFELSEEARKHIVLESARQLHFKSSDEILKDLGVPRAVRRALAHNKRKKPRQTPAHTVRAQAVADRLAAERQKAKAA